MPLLNFPQIVQERIPGFTRPKYNLKKFYIFLSILSFLLSIFSIYEYFILKNINLGQYNENLVYDDQNILNLVNDEFLNSDNEMNIPIKKFMILDSIEIKKAKKYNVSMQIPNFTATNSLFFKEKEIKQFTKQISSDSDDEIVYYPKGLIADTMPFDQIIFLKDSSIQAPEYDNIYSNRLDGQKIIEQKEINNLRLPKSWELNNQEQDQENKNDLIISDDESSVLPKKFIKNKRLINWMSISSFKNNHFNLGKIKLEKGKYKILLVNYDLNQNYEFDFFKNRKFYLRERERPIFLGVIFILNGILIGILAFL